MKNMVKALIAGFIFNAGLVFCGEVAVDFDNPRGNSIGPVITGNIGIIPVPETKNTKIDDPGDAYEYPVKPGTEEWKALNGYQEMLSVCRVPEQILQKMSTTGLIDTALDYPLFGNVWWSRSSIQQGFAHMFSEFNGARELFKRKDAGALLLAKYRGMDPAGFENGASLEERDSYVMRLQGVEILLAQDAVQAALTESQRAELKKLAFAKYEVKKTLEDYGTLDREIISLFETDVAQKNNTTRSYPTTVPTPKGSQVSATQMEQKDEMDWRQIMRCNSSYASEYPNAKQEAPCSNLYNCHSYAWHNQSIPNMIWINTPNQARYWEDGSYSLWFGDIFSGMKLNYTRDDHSAIFISGANPAANPFMATCRSKWGSGPKMLHICGYSPYIATGLAVYRSSYLGNEK